MDRFCLNGFSEVMLCDFTSGVSEVSFTNLERPGGVLPMMCKSLFAESFASGISSDFGQRDLLRLKSSMLVLGTIASLARRAFSWI